MPADGVAARPRLLVSLHDVSPLTLDACRAAVALLAEAGVAPAALTVLAIPHHLDQIALDRHPPTVAFLRELAAAGATLVSHGLSHQMQGPAPRAPRRWLAARWFARGQGEFVGADRADTERRLAAAQAILVRAQLAPLVVGFVPPAWLLSPEAAAAVAGHGFAFVERYGGIDIDGARRARRLIGWGSLTAIEAVATAAWARLQLRRRPVDTRVAIHPQDMARARTRRSITRTVRLLTTRLQPVTYQAYVTEQRARAA